jgi:hypothetical protein
MIDVLKNIDGKVISGLNSEKTSNSTNVRSSREVEFRKSLFGGFNDAVPVTVLGPETVSVKSKPVARKSCLKNAMADLIKDEPVKAN